MLIFIDIPEEYRIPSGIVVILLVFITYLLVWRWANKLHNVNLNIEGSTVNITTGDIFKQNGLKAIAFNEYFDTLVDDKVIAKKSLNGIFIEQYINTSVEVLDHHIESYNFEENEIINQSVDRKIGKKTKYRIGTICVYHDYLLTAFAKFDEKNSANLTMPEYLEFLINFWDKVNKVYAQQSVSTTIFGSGITRIKEHRNISDEDLLKIMLWTFRISEMRFKHPAKLTIVIHEDKIDQINLLDIKSAKNGI
ncbi:hypothetical protein OURE66S_03872 [Oligella ureolytica]